MRANAHYPTDDEVRLVGGSRENEGRVEVKHEGEWGVVCNDSWNTPDADVTCRQLGYRYVDHSGYSTYCKLIAGFRVWPPLKLACDVKFANMTIPQSTISTTEAAIVIHVA